VANQTVRHRDFFLPVTGRGEVIDDDAHATPPGVRTTWLSVGLLVTSLIGVVGLAKVTSPAIESGVSSAGLPHSFVGVLIALLVLLPESIAAVRAAHRGRFQTSLNLALGSSIATIGLTIPTIAIAKIWIDTPLQLGLSSLQVVLLTLTIIVSVLTVVPGRTTRLQGVVHMALFAAFVFLATSP
jgi:Ca2+:H+ antiporter